MMKSSEPMSVPDGTTANPMMVPLDMTDFPDWMEQVQQRSPGTEKHGQ